MTAYRVAYVSAKGMKYSKPSANILHVLEAAKKHGTNLAGIQIFENNTWRDMKYSEFQQYL